jgi:nucleoid DNA-binding protein
MPLPKKPRNLGRAHLGKQLQERGKSFRKPISRRKAVDILDEIFDQMKQALARGEEVPFPFGKLKMKRHKHREKRGWFLNQITTIYKKPFTVTHAMDAKGMKLLEPKPQGGKVVIPPKPWLQSGK